MRSINAQASLLLIFFFFFFNEAQGIRMGNWMMKPVGLLEKALEEKNLLIEEGFRKMNLCKNPHGNSGMLFLDEGDLKGNSRKLLTATPSSTSTRSVKEKGLGNNNSEAVSENLEAGLQHYPYLIDIAEMDYSPAKRKPPIHN